MTYFFTLFIFLFSSINAMDFEELSRRYLESPAPEKTADQILAENKDNPEFMGCTEWLKKEHPDFSQEELSGHPLFSLLEQTMQLADFEVDVLENFVHQFMETDMHNQQGITLISLRDNAMAAKYLVTNIVDLLQEKKTIPQIVEEYLESRFLCIVEYQAELMGCKSTDIDMSGCKAVRSASSELEETYNGFMRSYNTKNRVMRDLLYFLKDQEPTPLSVRLSPKLINFIKLSVSIHPFLNKENDEWTDYEDALKLAEARDFLSNAETLGINLKKEFKERNITGMKVRKSGYKTLQSFPSPRFLIEEKKEERALLPGEKKRKKKNKKRKTGGEQTLQSQTIISSEEKPNVLSQESSSNLIRKEPCENKPDANKLLIEKKQEAEVSPSSASAPLQPLKKSTALNEEESDASSHRYGNKHIKTILNIFSPKGYVHLDSQKIINAWNHVLGKDEEKKGYHKKGTGNSHQPLYAELSDASRVVMGLFKSPSYGPRYTENHIRKAFEKIGFGRQWLEDQGYILDPKKSS